MRNMLKNKKGFTLVELLAVIVILALLIVITANTILPMLNRTKASGMVTYAEKVLSNAQTNVEADKLTGGLDVAVIDSGDGGDLVKFYKIKKDLTEAENYFGCVRYNVTDETYQIKMFSYDDNLYLYSTTDLSVGDITDASKFKTKNITSDNTASIEEMETRCASVDTYGAVNEAATEG